MGIKNVSVFSSFPPHSYVALRKLMELGFLSKEPIEINGASIIRPLDFTTEVLRHISAPEGYTEKEDVWLKVYGKKDSAGDGLRGGDAAGLGRRRVQH